MKKLKFPNIEDAGAIAAILSKHLDANDQAFFVAGFQECVKYISGEKQNNSTNILKCYKVCIWKRCIIGWKNKCHERWFFDEPTKYCQDCGGKVVF